MIISAPTATAPRAGQRKLRFRLSSEVLRQASKGPTAVSKSSSKATGTITLLKNGGPTVTLCPCRSSEINGNHVPHSTVKQAKTKSRLLNRKLDSREMSDSSLCSLVRYDLFLKKNPANTMKTIIRNHLNHPPIGDCAKACTEFSTPLRVRYVPRIESQKVVNTSHMFQTFSMPRFSCIMTECRNAVPVSQGSREAFSTGSQPQ